MSHAPLPPAKTKEFATVFDRLIDSNLALTKSVEKLVRTAHGVLTLSRIVLAFNAILVAIVIFVMWRSS